VRKLLEVAGTRLKARDMLGRVQAVRDELGLVGLAELLGVGEPTLADILGGLARPGRDPRDELPPPVLRQDVLKMEDLREGMRLRGTVRNVVDFGAFVDIGVKQDGLVHVSKMADHYVQPFRGSQRGRYRRRDSHQRGPGSGADRPEYARLSPQTRRPTSAGGWMTARGARSL